MCTNVVRVDGAASKISISDFDFDGNFDMQPTDGILTFNADSNDYVSDTYPPGVYTVTITGTASGSTAQL